MLTRVLRRPLRTIFYFLCKLKKARFRLVCACLCMWRMAASQRTVFCLPPPNFFSWAVEDSQNWISECSSPSAGAAFQMDIL